MGKAGCAIALIATVVIGGGALYYVLTAFSAGQWFFSSGTASTGWVEGFVVILALVVFAIGFFAIMLMPDTDESNSTDNDPPS